MDIRSAEMHVLDARGMEVGDSRIRFSVAKGDIEKIEIYSGLPDGVQGQRVMIVVTPLHDEGARGAQHKVFNAVTRMNRSCLFVDGFREVMTAGGPGGLMTRVERVRWTLT